jgi:hypothetical protein
MNSELRRSNVAALIAAFAPLLVSSVARAQEPTVDQCLAANERAIALRGEHRLIESRAELAVCSAASCPTEVRDECARRIEELNAAIPTVIFEAKDAAGRDLSDVRVKVDGKPFADQLQGVSVPVDPGKHGFSFEAPGQAPVHLEILVVEGAKERRERVVIGSAAASPPPAADVPPRQGDVQRILGWTAVGAGAVGVGLGIFFELQSSSKLSDADAICPGDTCPPVPGLSHAQSDAQYNARIHDLTSDANAAGTAAAISFAAGGVLIAGGLALVFTAPRGERPVAFVPAVAPGFGGMAMSGRF